MREENDYFREWLDEQTKVRRLLLIDDSMEDCCLIQRYTIQYHCEWMIARDMDSASYALHSMGAIGGFALIFLDLDLGRGPGEGVKAYKALKKSWPTIPVVVLSGMLTTEAISAVCREGGVMFAQKPDSFSDSFFKELFKIMSIPIRPGFKPLLELPPSI